MVFIYAGNVYFRHNTKKWGGVMMKYKYRVTEDLFLSIAVFLTASAIILKLFATTIPFGFSIITPTAILKFVVVCLLFNIALNLQDLIRK